jgi:hypothetical protein
MPKNFRKKAPQTSLTGILGKTPELKNIRQALC